MVGSKSEQGGIIKDGAKLVNAMANSVVPKFTVVVGNSYGAGNYALCGKAYDPKFMVAWPTAELAVMGGAQAAGVLLQIEVATRKKKGEEITPEREKELREVIESRYKEQVSPYYSAARLWVDAIIDPGTPDVDFRRHCLGGWSPSRRAVQDRRHADLTVKRARAASIPPAST